VAPDSREKGIKRGGGAHGDKREGKGADRSSDLAPPNVRAVPLRGLKKEWLAPKAMEERVVKRGSLSKGDAKGW